MKIKFTKDCGHHKEGEVLECEVAPGAQYVAGKFAEVYVEPVPAPKPEPAPKPKAKKE